MTHVRVLALIACVALSLLGHRKVTVFADMLIFEGEGPLNGYVIETEDETESGNQSIVAEGMYICSFNSQRNIVDDISVRYFPAFLTKLGGSFPMFPIW